MKPKMLYGGIGSLLFLIVAGGVWYASQDDGVSPEKKLDYALELLEKTGPNALSDRRKARTLAQDLKEIGFYVPGKPDYMYILGVSAFRDAMDRVEDEKFGLFKKTIGYLDKIKPGALRAKNYLFEVTYMEGVSRYYLGDHRKAEDDLKIARTTYKEKEGFASYLLASIRLDSGDLNTKIDGIGAIEYNSTAIKHYEKMLEENVTGQSFSGNAMEMLNRLNFQKARINLEFAELNTKQGRSVPAKKNLAAVTAAIAALTGEVKESGQAKLIEAQARMVEENYGIALGLIRDVKKDRTLDENSQRMASYLAPYCVEKRGDIDNAIRLYKKVAAEYERYDEGVASNLRLAHLLMGVHRDEESIASFGNALKISRKRKTYLNRWVSRKEAKRVLLKTWKSWVADNKYEYAIRLSEMFYPLFPLSGSAKYKATASQKKAEKFESDRLQKTAKEIRELKETYHLLWRDSGKAYSELAETLRLSSRYADMLLVSVQHFRKGSDIAKSLEQLEKYIGAAPSESLPGALLMKGQLLMDQGQYSEAALNFTRLIEEFPTDSGVFEAQYLTGLAYLENDELEKAGQVWRELLVSGDLTPDAKEWRHSMYSLAEMHFNSGVMLKYEAGLQNVTPEESALLLKKAYSNFDDASSRFDEYLERYESSLKSDQARFYLAKSNQYSAELPKLELKNADTENAKLELETKRRNSLEKAKDYYKELISRLVYEYEGETLDEIRLQIYKDSHFLFARTLFQLGEYDKENYAKAIVAFNAASTRFSDDPQVLLAYVQVAICYQNLKVPEPEEARGVLSQAGVILGNLPPESFDNFDNSNFTSAEWGVWLDKFRQSQGFSPVATGEDASL